MQDIATFSDAQRRCIAHIYMDLRAIVRESVDYDRGPEFFPFPDEDRAAMEQLLVHELTALMVAAHPEEAALIEAAIAAGWA